MMRFSYVFCVTHLHMANVQYRTWPKGVATCGTTWWDNCNETFPQFWVHVEFPYCLMHTLIPSRSTQPEFLNTAQFTYRSKSGNSLVLEYHDINDTVLSFLDWEPVWILTRKKSYHFSIENPLAALASRSHLVPHVLWHVRHQSPWVNSRFPSPVALTCCGHQL
jgi:hypothetical protein